MEYVKEIIEIIKHKGSELKTSIFHSKYPRELQFPITYKCNFNCVMCGMRTLIDRPHCSLLEISTILSDKLFKEITNVGVNGGEPFLRKDIVQLVKTLIEKLPKLETISIISNGFFSDVIVEELPRIKSECNEKGIRLQLSLSVDGFAEMQDFMRGNKNAFQSINKTISILQADIEKYCDSLNVICTITKHNVFNLFEVYNWAKEKGLNVSYNLATINKRINNEEMVDDFSVFSDREATFLAQEFFYKLYKESRDKRYYSLFLFVRDRKRNAGCSYMFNRGVTLTPDGNLAYCATHSEIIGNCLEDSAFSIFMEHQKYHKRIRKDYCQTCSHYIYGLNSYGLKVLHKENNHNRYLRLIKKEGMRN